MKRLFLRQQEKASECRRLSSPGETSAILNDIAEVDQGHSHSQGENGIQTNELVTTDSSESLVLVFF